MCIRDSHSSEWTQKFGIVQNYARKLSSARKRSISTIFSNSAENKKMNLEEQNNKPQPISNDSVHSFFNIFDKKETVQNGGYFPFFSNCNVTFNINK